MIDLSTEIQLLLRAEFHHGIPAAPAIRQLAEELERPLPDVIPPRPEQRAFKWPQSGGVMETTRHTGPFG